MDYGRRYRVDILLCDRELPPPWSAPTWQKLEPSLGALFAGARGPAVVDSAQEERDDFVKFGRLGFNPRSHAKWVHRANTRRSFFYTRMSAPGHRACWNQKRPPDVFLCLWNLDFDTPKSSVPLIVLAVPVERAESAAEAREVLR